MYRVTVDAGVTGNVFLKGHRIRVEISSSNFPRFDRNPNTGGNDGGRDEAEKASQTVYHDRAASVAAGADGDAGKGLRRNPYRITVDAGITNTDGKPNCLP